MKNHQFHTTIYVSLILVFLMSFSKIAYSSDKELFDKILKNAITTIILEKYPSVETNNGIVFKLNRVFLHNELIGKIRLIMKKIN